ncbi:hypothetical protein OB905_10895 [Halobacteria archaeon AArc-dxtr1]|nr:hypothetical protein [Halobacteria archaeon AArc-dxtr1]
MPSIHLTDVELKGTEIRYKYEYDRRLHHLFRGTDYVIGYDRDVEDIPIGIATIPFVASVAPIAWTEDIEIVVPTLDPTFGESLQTAREILDELYPELNFGTGGNNITCEYEAAVKERRANSTSSATLFSGGVDGLASYIEHRDESPGLIFVEYKSTDYDEDLEYKRLKDNARSFAEFEEVDFNSIDATNKRVVDYNSVNLLYRRVLNGYSWWQKVNHGLWFTAISIPICYQEGYGKLYVPSSFTDQCSIRWATAPELINQLAWTSGTAKHDLSQTGRQKKWKLISDFLSNRNPELYIQSCEPYPCGECFHCARNLAAMLLEGIQPKHYGYRNPKLELNDIRLKILSGEWEMDEVNRQFWEDIQNSLPRKPNESINGLSAKELDFYNWLNTEELSRLEQNPSMPNYSSKQEVYRHLLQKSPLLAFYVKSIYTRLLL